MLSTFCEHTVIPLLLRVALAAIFIFHGLDLVGGSDKEWGAAWNKTEGAPSAPVQLAVAWGELLGGVALACGFLTRFAAAGIIAIMVGAIVTVHGQHGFDIGKGGFEYNFAIIAMSLCLVLAGAGPLAVDRIFRFRRKDA